MGNEGAVRGLLAENEIIGKLLFRDLLGSGPDMPEEGADDSNVVFLGGFGKTGEAHVSDHLLA